MRAKHYKFTAKDIATLCDLPLHQVYRDIRGGRLDPESLRAVVEYVLERRPAAARS